MQTQVSVIANVMVNHLRDRKYTLIYQPFESDRFQMVATKKNF
jgi:hypothetical protein